MSIEDQDNLYVLKDKESEDIDRSPLNYAAYDDSESHEVKEEEENLSDSKGCSAFGIMLRIMFDPVEGWKKMRRKNLSIEKMQSGCFYPILALLALSRFADFFYSVNVNLTEVVTGAVVEFVAYFFSYFCIPVIVSWFLPREASDKLEQQFGKKYVLISLSTLALFSVFINVLPMIWPILIFLPIWTLYIMFKGVRFFLLTENLEIRLYLLSAVAVIGIPVLIDYGLNYIMPY